MKKRLVENFYLPPRRIDESEEQGKWKAPVWNLDSMNLNGRIYPTELAERIVRENPTTIANDGHESDLRSGYEYKEAVAICKRPRIENNQLWVDIEFIDDEYQRKLEAIMAKGVQIGVSSVGYGEVDDGGRINPESYELVRFLDFVTSPAGCVYATRESEEAEKQKEKREESVDDTRAEAMARRRNKLASRLSKIYLGGIR